MNHLTRILVLCFMSLLFSSCFGGKIDTVTTDTPQKAGLVTYSGDDFSLQVPAAWEDLSTSSGSLPKPSSGILELALASNSQQNSISNNLVILSQYLEDTTSSKEYAVMNHVGSKREYFSYNTITSKSFSFLSGEPSMLYNFSAKYGQTTPHIQFIQTAHVCNKKKAFVLTIAIPMNIADIGKYENMLSSFSCK